MTDTMTDAQALPAMVLYLRDLCALCDAAVTVLAQARAGAFVSVFIEGDGALEARYGARVPVLVDASGRELDWPFDPGKLRRWRADAVLDAPGTAAAR